MSGPDAALDDNGKLWAGICDEIIQLLAGVWDDKSTLLAVAVMDDTGNRLGRFWNDIGFGRFLEGKAQLAVVLDEIEKLLDDTLGLLDVFFDDIEKLLDDTLGLLAVVWDDDGLGKVCDDNGYFLAAVLDDNGQLLAVVLDDKE